MTIALSGLAITLTLAAISIRLGTLNTTMAGIREELARLRKLVP